MELVSKAFKLDAIALVTEQGYTRIEAAQSLGINTHMLGRWMNEQTNNDSHAFLGHGKLTPEKPSYASSRNK